MTSTLVPTLAHAACSSILNGAPMPPDVCAAARQVYGSVQPGHYWMDGNGTWGLVGSAVPRETSIAMRGAGKPADGLGRTGAETGV